MYFDYEWIKEYLEKAPALDEAANLLNSTGLETEVDGVGLEIEHTVNRPDAMSHFGIARELAVKTGARLIFPEIDHRQIPPLEGWHIESEDTHGCWRYLGLYIDHIQNTPSPDWLKRKLDRIEQTSHGTIVDLTNFLLWEFGHPSHAFDAQKIKGQEIRIRIAKQGEALTTLDGKHHSIGGLLCISDQKTPIALAGVMGGKDSEVDSETSSLLLELAMFDPIEVRKSAKKMQILSDAKHRFERGVDEESMEKVLRRFLFLLAGEQPQIVVKGCFDFKSRDYKRPHVNLRKNRMDQLLGLKLSMEEVETLLQRMDFKPRETENGWALEVPGYKVDVTREEDVIEEVIRFAGLERLPSTLPALPGSDYRPGVEVVRRQKLRRALKELGLQEIITYSFMSRSEEDLFRDEGSAVEIRNPMSESSRVLRRNILPQVVLTARRNFSRGQKNLRLFEMGHVFGHAGEIYSLACLISHTQEKEFWHEPNLCHPFYAMKGVLEELAKVLAIKDLKLVQRKKKGMDPHICLAIEINGHAIGWIGALDQTVKETMSLDVPVAVMELELAFLKEHIEFRERQFDLSPFPAMQIDMAFVVEEKISFEQVKKHIGSQKLPFLESLVLFDVYSGKSLEKGKKSLGFRFLFRASDRTLTSEEIHAAIKGMSESVMKEFNATIRS